MGMVDEELGSPITTQVHRKAMLPLSWSARGSPTCAQRVAVEVCGGSDNKKNNTYPMKHMNTWWDMHRRTKKHLLFPGRIVTALGEIYPTCLLPLYTNWLPAAHLHARKLLSASAFLCTGKKYYQPLLCVQEAHSWRQEFTAHLMPCMRQMKRKTGTQHAGRSEGQYKVRLGTS